MPDNPTPVVILRLRNMTAIDATGLLTLEEVAEKLHGAGRTLILCGAQPQPALSSELRPVMCVRSQVVALREID